MYIHEHIILFLFYFLSIKNTLQCPMVQHTDPVEWTSLLKSKLIVYVLVLFKFSAKI